MNYSNSNIICVQETLLKSNLGFIIYIQKDKTNVNGAGVCNIYQPRCEAQTANNITEVVVIDVCKKRGVYKSN